MKVILKSKKDGVTESTQHEIEKLDLFQLQAALKVIKNIFKEAEDSELAHSIIEVMEGKGDMPEAKEMLSYLTGGFELLLMELPEQAFKLLSVMSGIEHKVLMAQKVEDVFDIYDAILEVNDIEALIERGKKSLAVTRKRTSWLKKVRTATQTAAAQA